AAEKVDLVDEPVALAGSDRRLGRVVGSAYIDASGRAGAGAQLTTDALLHAVLVAVEDMAAMKAGRLGSLDVRILARDPVLGHGLERDLEAVEQSHRATSRPRRRARLGWPRRRVSGQSGGPRRQWPGTAGRKRPPQPPPRGRHSRSASRWSR